MGKNVPLRIGRKSKRELNPLEKMRRKEKQKKNLKQFISKMNKKANGEFVTKVKHRRSPSPESNDPMLGELISNSSLKQQSKIIPDFDPAIDIPQVEKSEPVKKAPSEFVPVALSVSRNAKMEISSGEESEEESEEDIKEMISRPKIEYKKKNDQTMFKALLNHDEKLSDFFSSISDLI
jgi:hypothetical protein